MNTQVATDFLQSLKNGDKVLVCQEDGEVYCGGQAWPIGEKIVRVSGTGKEFPSFRETFSRKTGKQRGGSLVLQPYDEARYRASIAQREEAKRAFEQRQEARNTEKRDGFKTAILSVADMIDDTNLDGLSTSDLQALMTILNKLGGEC